MAGLTSLISDVQLFQVLKEIDLLPQLKAECKTMLSDDLKCFSIFCKSAWNFACSFQLNRNTSPCIFLAGLLFVFEK